jgi:hypothetical protein
MTERHERTVLFVGLLLSVAVPATVALLTGASFPFVGGSSSGQDLSEAQPSGAKATSDNQLATTGFSVSEEPRLAYTTSSEASSGARVADLSGFEPTEARVSGYADWGASTGGTSAGWSTSGGSTADTSGFTGGSTSTDGSSGGSGGGSTDTGGTGGSGTNTGGSDGGGGGSSDGGGSDGGSGGSGEEPTPTPDPEPTESPSPSPSPTDVEGTLDSTVEGACDLLNC